MAAVIMESCLQTAEIFDQSWVQVGFKIYFLGPFTHLAIVIYEGVKLLGTAGYDIQST